MSSAFMGKVEYKSTFRAVQGFSCPVFDKLNDLFSVVALGTICNPVGRKANILFNHQAEAGAFTVKRLSGFLPRFLLLFGLALLFLAQPVFASEPENFFFVSEKAVADNQADAEPNPDTEEKSEQRRGEIRGEKIVNVHGWSPFWFAFALGTGLGLSLWLIPILILICIDFKYRR